LDTFAASCALRLPLFGMTNVVPRYQTNGQEIGKLYIPFPDGSQGTGFIVDQVTSSGIEPIIRGLMASSETPLVPGVPRTPGMVTILARMIQRTRDLGVPAYTQVRKDLNMSVPTAFQNISSNPHIVAVLQSLYGSVQNVDGCVGALVEDVAPTTKTGPTLGSIWYTLMLRLRDGDRFYYYSNTSGYDAATSLKIRKVSVAGLMYRNGNATIFPNDIIFKVNQSSSFTNDTSFSTAHLPGNASSKRQFRLSQNTFVLWSVAEPYMALELITDHKGWIGFGLGLGMPNQLDISVIVWTNGIPNVVDYFAGLNGQFFFPSADVPSGGRNDLRNFTYTLDSLGWNHYKWLKPIESNDTYDKNFSRIGYTPCVFAFGPGNSPMYHGSRRGVVYIDFFADNSSSNNGTITIPQPIKKGGLNAASLLLMHGILFTFGCLVVIPVGIITARYLNTKSWLELHIKVTQLAFSQTTISLLTVVLDRPEKPFTNHGIMGIVSVLVLTLAIASGGVLGLNVKVPRKVYLLLRLLHLPLGLATWIIGIYSCVTGAQEMVDLGQSWILYFLYVLIAFNVIIFLVAEIWRFKYGKIAGDKLMYRYKRITSSLKSKSGLLSDNDNAKPFPQFNWIEFNEKVRSGSLWTVIDGVVYVRFIF
jgi:hypothetical protein